MPRNCGRPPAPPSPSSSPVVAARSPVMFVVLLGTVVTAWLAIAGGPSDPLFGFNVAVSLILLATVLFANFAESIAEARGRGQAASLRAARAELVRAPGAGRARGEDPGVGAAQGRSWCAIAAGEMIPADGEIIHGIASINEAAVTGESAPVLREAGTDRSGVIGGTKVLTDEILVRVSSDPGHSFLDRMIALVEGASRLKTPNELALTVLLSAMTLAFLVVVVALPFIAAFVGAKVGVGDPGCAAGLPDPDHDRRPAAGDRHRRHEPRAGSERDRQIRQGGRDRRRHRHPAARQDRHHHPRRPPGDGVLPGRRRRQVAAARCRPAGLAGRPDAGRQVHRRCWRASSAARWTIRRTRTTIAFSAQTRMSGVDLGERRIRKGAGDSVERWAREQGAPEPTTELHGWVEQVARAGGTPLVVAEGRHMLGVIALSDVVKHGVRERFARLRALGVKTVMITGDNPLTAAAIAATAGVDDFIAEATPEAEAAAHPRRAGAGQAGGDGRRRHQRRAGAGPGRHRPGDECRHAGGEGGRQHGRPRLRPDQAAAGGRDRQAAADHPRRADHVLAGQ